MLRWAATIALAMLFGCSDVAIPQGVDLAALNALYNDPSGDLQSEEVQMLLRDSRPKRSFAQSLTSLRLFGDAITNGQAEANKKSNKGKLRVDGNAQVTVKCPGTSPEDSSNQGDPTMAPGTVELTLGIENSNFLQNATANALRCRLAALKDIGTVDLPNVQFNFDFQRPLPLRNPIPDGMLIKISGTTRLADMSVDIDGFDFRIVNKDTIEVRLTNASGGTVIAFINRDGTVGIREVRGTWTCGGEDQPCVGP